MSLMRVLDHHKQRAHWSVWRFSQVLISAIDTLSSIEQDKILRYVEECSEADVKEKEYRADQE